MKLKQAIADAKKSKRKFKQSVEIAINIKGVDFSKPNNRVNVEVFLPKGRGKPKKACLIAEEELAVKSKGKADRIIRKEEIGTIAKSKKNTKKLANEFEIFIAQANLMPTIGKAFGQVLAPRGKMPKPVPPATDIAPIVTRLKNTVIVKVKGKNMPVLHAPIGTEDMSDDDLESNAKAIIKTVAEKVSAHNIKDVYVKTTMGKPIKVDEVLD